jgi:hypothetical protein
MSDTPAPDTETAEGAATAPTPSWPAPSAAGRRRWHIKQTLTNLVIREVVEELGPNGVPSGPDPGFAEYGNRPQPDPLTAVRAARTVRREAAGLLGGHIDRARGAGHTWTELAGALGLTRDAEREGIPLDEAAFHWATTGRIDGDYAPRVWGAEPRRSWRCASCEERVTDHGPFNGHPDHDETGHAAGCVRHTAELAAWRTRNGWADDDDRDGDDEDDDDEDGNDGDGNGDR